MRNHNVLFVTPEIVSKTGGGVVSVAFRKVVKESSATFHEISLPEYTSAREKAFFSLRGFLRGMTHKGEKRIDSLLSAYPIDTVVFNTSYYGGTIRRLRGKYPNIRIVCLFHNVEVLFIRDYLKETKQAISVLTMGVAWWNERLSTRYSNKIICLNKRDFNEIERIYGRKPDAIAPLSLEDRFDGNKLHYTPTTVGAFIGSRFYANYYGVKWFVKNVAPHISSKILIIGKGFETCREEFADVPNIDVIGTVDDLDAYYYDISFIVSPIFSGSGMKTKTAEALMFGKTIFGTTEAFQGYDIDFDKVGGLCNTAEEFIRKINLFESLPDQFNSYSRDMFVKKYSLDSFRKIIQTFFKNIT